MSSPDDPSRLPPEPPGLEHVADLVVEVATPISVGSTPDGTRRVVPIVGGWIRGPQIRGVVLPAGADYQMIREGGYTTLDARYVIGTDDGSTVYVVNTGVRYGPPEVMQRLAHGEPVDPRLVYFRTVLRFETGSDQYAWMTGPIFVGVGVRHPTQVELSIWRVT